MGHKLGQFLGKYGEAVGGGVLILLAIKMFLEG
jgi:putative Mn2+ efflux pump MntP